MEVEKEPEGAPAKIQPQSYTRTEEKPEPWLLSFLGTGFKERTQVRMEILRGKGGGRGRGVEAAGKF